MTQRALDRLAGLAAVDSRFSADSATRKLAEGPRAPDHGDAAVRHGVDIAELLRRLEADALWATMVDPSTVDDPSTDG